MRKLLALLFFMAPFSTWAQDLPVEPIIDNLLPERTGPVVQGASEALVRGIQRNKPIPEFIDLPKTQLVVPFEGQTHRLTEPGMRALRSIGSALKDPRLVGSTFQIGSHVYVQGDNSASQTLATRRANAIVEHLSVFYGFESGTLVAVGYGATSPFDISQAAHPMNQRIEIVNLSPLE